MANECNCCDDSINQTAESVWVTFGPNDQMAYVCGKDSDCVGDELIKKENMIWIEGELTVILDGEQLFRSNAGWSPFYLDFVKRELASLPKGSYDDGDYFRNSDGEVIAESTDFISTDIV